MSGIDLPAILFVPGIRAKPPAEQQEQALQRCLEAALARQQFAAAAELSRQLQVVGWSFHFYGRHEDIAADRPGIERLVRGAGNPDEDRREAASLRRRWVAAMYAIGDRFPLVGSLFATHRMQTRLQEINRYFRNQGGERTWVCELLKEHLRTVWAQNRRVILIGHSFGSVIAYDTLWELTHVDREGAAHKVDLFVTMGSPLTMNYIRQRIKGAGRTGHARYPCNIRRWLNLAAIGEVTALDRRMSECFAEMLELGIVDAICDDLSVLNRFRGPDGLNVHKCYGYLASDEFAKALIEFSQPE